jgi:site-specific recombinase XerD
MANQIRVLLWLHRTKTNKVGLAPLMLRLTYQNKRAEKATGHYVNPKDWNATKQRLKGNSQNSTLVNEWINETVVKISNVVKDEIRGNNTVYLPSILTSLFAEIKEEPGLLKLMAEHNEKIRERLGNDFSYSTYEKYVFTYNKVKAFIENSLNKKDILLRDLTAKFIVEFDHYLRAHDNNKHNTAVKYCINLKCVINSAVLQGILEKNPFNSYKTVYKDTQQVYLDEHEVMAIENTRLEKAKYLLARDLFLFQCSTGLAYTDMAKLSTSDISTDTLGRKWIIKPRQKSGIVSTIPLLPKAIELIEKYNTDIKNQSCLFPSYSIQKYNEYISEIGVLAGIHKRLSSHVGRRTFGNIALARGLSLNVISKILGHSTTLITQRIYAITTQKIITNEIEKW